ncbi:hypothetical protein LTS07_010510 [Exophiala sideris]|uniref:Uncharacterized protein n=1 Tax=Exophiala sideris TaxID=1016849 RepID=A0ABR0IWU1_9EURO|nr:hypothetical protein LTS07_010510 [Exophiala sideris]KAK5025991.1 hypothetical protein LTR13_010148 [Exophiala sideris]KAK5050678.1 hypothetical protein LTR69_010534 [Exophiala sideris]KAK5177163.1 hypothetical protein LTR44_010291 [Eurotiomycetes sp. CCFEE 6388]
MPSVSPLPLVQSPPPMPILKAFSRAGPHVHAFHPGPTIPREPQISPRLRQAFPPELWQSTRSPPPRPIVTAFSRAGPHVHPFHPGPTIPRVSEISTRLRQAFPPEVWKSTRSPPPRPRLKAFSRANGPRIPSRAVFPCPTVAPSKASPRRQPMTPRRPSPPTDTSAPAPTTARQGVRRVRISGPLLLSRTGTSTTSASSSSQGDFDPDAAFVDSSLLESPIPDSPTVIVTSSRTQPITALDSTPGFFARCGQILDTTVTKVLGWVRSWF